MDDSLTRRLNDAKLICEDIDPNEALTTVLGAETSALNEMCCDTCRYDLLIQLGNQAAHSMMQRYLRTRANASRY